MQTTHSQASEEQEQEVSLPIVFAPSEFAPNLIQTTLTAFAPKYAYYLEYFSLFKGDKNYLEYFSLFKGDKNYLEYFSLFKGDKNYLECTRESFKYFLPD